MIKMINALTGGDMWVADNRVNEYKAAGHKLAAENAEKPKKAEPEKVEEPAKAIEPEEAPQEEAPKKKPVRKTTSKAKK